MFLGLIIKFNISLAILSFKFANGLFVSVLLGTNWLNAVGACLAVSWLELLVDLKKLNQKKLTDSSKDFVGSEF